MNDWQYTFDPVSKSEWIRQIEKDLKQQPITSLSSEWWPGESLTPLAHPEDIHESPIHLPDFLFTRAPVIQEWVDTQDIHPEVLNARILDALRYGAEHLVLSIEDPAEIKTGEWLASVHLDMVRIEIDLNFNAVEDLESLIKKLPGEIHIRFNREGIRDNNYLQLVKSDTSFASILDRCRFVYAIPSSGAWVDLASGVFSRICQDLGLWLQSGRKASAFFSSCILSLEADPFFFKQIVQTRVVELIYFNLLSHYAITPEAVYSKQIESHISPRGIEEPSQYLIRASMSALAAALSGSIGLCIHHGSIGEDRFEFYRRIHRNIHHLLHLESEMYKGTDPLAGAYTLDSYSRKWAAGIWDRLQL